jgi:hypothetical protein
MLGKRWKQMHEQTLEAENASKVGPSKMKFGVTAKPVSRDADEEDVMDQETPTELVDFSEITSKVAHPQHEQMLDR